jgi:hypothetical protein
MAERRTGSRKVQVALAPISRSAILAYWRLPFERIGDCSQIILTISMPGFISTRKMPKNI